LKKKFYFWGIEINKPLKKTIMKTQEITIRPYLSDTNDFRFKHFKSDLVDQIDVYHKNKRVAIVDNVNGQLLKWISSSNDISIKNIVKLEKMVSRLFKKATKEQY
jgi:hypothetical protein